MAEIRNNIGTIIISAMQKLLNQTYTMIIIMKATDTNSFLAHARPPFALVRRINTQQYASQPDLFLNEKRQQHILNLFSIFPNADG